MSTTEIVTQVFAELTRYPLEILTPDAELEAELGIDSVKRAEIIATLQRRFELPADAVIPEGMNTIAAVARFVDSARSAGGAPAAAAAQAAAPAAPAAPPPAAQAPQPVYAPMPIAAPQLAPADGLAWASAAAPAQRPAPAAPSYAPPAPAYTAPAPTYAPPAPAYAPPAPTYAPPAPTYAPPAPSFAASTPSAGSANGPDTVRKEVLGVLHEVTGEALRRLGAPVARGVGASHPSAPRQTPWIPEGHKPLTGRVALVTGSGHGLGKAIVTRLASLGCRVILNSFHSREAGERTAAELRDRGADAHHIWASVARRDHLERMYAEIEARYGYLDYLVSNASNGIIAPLNVVTEDHWDKSFKTNVVGLHRGAMLAAPLMDRRGGGRIVTISSPGSERYIEHFGCQGPIKAALESLVRYLAIELGPRNILVNSLSAGPVYGDLLNKYPDGDRLIPYWETRTSHGRLGTEEEMAEAVVWLFSPAAEAFNGAILLADSTGSIRV